MSNVDEPRQLLKDCCKIMTLEKLNEAADLLRCIDEPKAACYVMHAMLLLEPMLPIPKSVAEDLAAFGLTPTNRIMTPEEMLDMDGTIEKAARASSTASCSASQNAPSTSTRQ